MTHPGLAVDLLVRPNLAVTNDSFREIVVREVIFRLENCYRSNQFLGVIWEIPAKKFADQN